MNDVGHQLDDDSFKYFRIYAPLLGDNNPKKKNLEFET